jgi:hypothetical protein
MVQGIVINQREGNLVISTTVRASRNGIAAFELDADVIEQKQGKVIIKEGSVQDGDFVVAIMTAKNEATGNVVRQKTTVLFPAGLAPVEDSTITLPSGTVVNKDSGVCVR